MLEFPFLYIGLRKTVKYILKLVRKKKFVRKKTGKNAEISNCSTDGHSDCKDTCQLAKRCVDS